MRSSWLPLAVSAAVTVVVVTLLVVMDTGPNVLLVAAVTMLAGVTIWLVAELLNATLDTPLLSTTPAAIPSAHNDRRVMRLRSGLTYAQHDDAALDQLRAGLVELVDDQLRTVHDIDREADPDTARIVVGGELWSLIDGSTPSRRLAEPRTLDRVLTLIEQL
jgi:hypothetical protein